LDEFERGEVVEEPLEELPEEEQPVEELAEEEPPEEELAEEEEEEQPGAKPEKPIKGPRFWAWSVAVLLMLFGLLLLVPAVWNLALLAPAAAGLVSEAAKNYESAQEAYGLLDTLEGSVQGIGLPGLSSGNFAMERRYVIWNKLYGPLAIAQNQPLEQYFPEGTRMPRSLRKLAAVSGELVDLWDGFYAQLNAAMGPAEGQSQSEWALEALEAARKLDGKAEARALYYEAVALQIAAGEPEMKEACLARIETLKKAPGGAFWMYGEAQRRLAIRDGDYAALISWSDARLKRSREDIMAMQHKMRALFLGGEEAKALKMADKYARRSAAETGMRLAKAEIYYRKGEYEQAIALCEEIINAADFNAAIASAADLKPWGSAMEAARVKAIALLLQGKPGEAMDLLNGTMEAAGRYLQYMNFDFGSYACTLLAAYAVNGELEGEGAQMLMMQLSMSNFPVPQAIPDLNEGKTTVAKIFTEGWGGFDA